MVFDINYLILSFPNSGSIDGSNQLIIKGRFQQKQIEHVLRHYISKYKSVGSISESMEKALIHLVYSLYV